MWNVLSFFLFETGAHHWLGYIDIGLGTHPSGLWENSEVWKEREAHP